MQKQLFIFPLVCGIILFCQRSYGQQEKPLTTGVINWTDPSMEALITRGTRIEVMASGMQNAEGPVWIRDSSLLLFSDTKGQAIYRLPLRGERTKFLDHSGFTGRPPYGEEPGTNGLALTPAGDLLICEHGDRRIAAYPLNGNYGKRTLTDNYGGKRLNSPNDLIIKSDGAVYFTDPPYGLPLKEADPYKETPVNGVYRMEKSGKTALLTGELKYPNGLAFSPDEKLLYISVSDQQRPRIMMYPVKADGSLGTSQVFFDAAGLPRERIREVTDGLKVDRQGNVWATGPGGLLVINPGGKLLGTIQTGEIFTNCAWSSDGALYITAGAFVYRVNTNTGGAGIR